MSRNQSSQAILTRPPNSAGSSGVYLKLSIMMFLQYGIWGAWLPLMFPFFNEYRGFTAGQIGTLAAMGAIGALISSIIAGQFADRYFNTERFLCVSHLVGAVLVWQLAIHGNLNILMVYSFLYGAVYAPTLALTNALAFRHLTNRDRDFSKVRVWGTIGWIAVGIGIGQWLLYQHGPTNRIAQVQGMGDAFRLSAILGAVLGVYCLFLPKTPPRQGSSRFAPLEALGEVKRNPLLSLFIVAFPVSVIHQFYFVRTAGFLGSPALKMPDASFINRIFGVGGGGLMTIGQISEILVVALIVPFLVNRLSRKTLLSIGLLAYILRFFTFAFLPYSWAVLPALALHGVCFGCFFFICFMIVDEETTSDVRASAQNLFNIIVMGFGVILGNLFAGWMDKWASSPGAGVDYKAFFSIPMYIAIICLSFVLIFYPRKAPRAAVVA